MKQYIFSVAFIASQFAIQAQDDVYYDPRNDKGLKKNASPNYQNQFENKSQSSGNFDDALPNNADPYRYDDANSTNRNNRNDDYSTNSNRSTTSSFFNDDFDDFYYTTRLRRFYNPSWGCGFWDPWYTDLFFYTGNPMFWGNNIYVNVLPRWSWWQPRQYVVVYDSWGWNNWGWNNWGWNHWNSPWNGFGWNNWGWDNWYGGGWDGWGWNNWYGNNWGWNNGFWNGYNQGYWNGYRDGMYGNWFGNGWYGKTYDASGPRFQQTSTNSGANSLPGRYGKTDETIPREGVLKPRTNNEGRINSNSANTTENPIVKPMEPRTAPNDGWRTAPNITETPRRNVPTELLENNPRNNRPENVVRERTQPENADRWNNVERNNNERFNNNRWNDVQREQPNRFTPSEQPSVTTPREQPSRTNEMRERLNRDMEPVQRPQRNFEPQQVQPQRVQPQRNFEPQREQPQRNFQPQMEQRGNMQRFDNGNRQMEMRQMQPQRMERSEPMQRNFDMNRGGAGGFRRNP